MRYIDKEPDFVTDAGVKFWYNPLCTLFAIDKGLYSCISWFTEDILGNKTILLIDNSTNLVLQRFISEEDCYKYLTTYNG